MVDPNPGILSDLELTLEISNASRRVHRAREAFQNERWEATDAIWDGLQRAVFAAEKHLRLCLAELSKRETAATFAPKPRRRQRTLVRKDIAVPDAAPPHKPADEPDGPPIIVYEPNGPRRWRKGDPIY